MKSWFESWAATSREMAHWKTRCERLTNALNQMVCPEHKANPDLFGCDDISLQFFCDTARAALEEVKCCEYSPVVKSDSTTELVSESYKLEAQS